MLPLQGTPVQFLVRELKSCMLQGAAEKTRCVQQKPHEAYTYPQHPIFPVTEPKISIQKGPGGSSNHFTESCPYLPPWAAGTKHIPEEEPGNVMLARC